MEHLREMGADLEHRWRDIDYRRESFAELAEDVLQRHAPHRAFTIENLLRWFHSTVDVPLQTPNPRFGQPPVIVFATKEFYLEILFWVDGTTDVHQHRFSGAFQVLSGSQAPNPVSASASAPAIQAATLLDMQELYARLWRSLRRSASAPSG